MSDMHDQETTPATGPLTAAPTQPVTGVLAEGREHPVEGRFIPAAPYTGWAEDTDDETEGDDTHTPAAPQEQARGDESAPDAPVVDQSVTDDLVIDDWIEAGDPDLELASARTVGDVRRGIEDWHCRFALSQQFYPVVFAAKGGRLYTADVGMIVRPATPDEVRGAVENAKEYERDMAEFMLKDRMETLDGYLGKSGA